MRLLAVFCVLCALVMGTAGLVLGAYGADRSANNSAILRTLLLDGKTASAISAKKTAQEVKLLLSQQAFDHVQTQSGQKKLQAVVADVEHHLDRTIRSAIGEAARQVAREVARHH